MNTKRFAVWESLQTPGGRAQVIGAAFWLMLLAASLVRQMLRLQKQESEVRAESFDSVGVEEESEA